MKILVFVKEVPDVKVPLMEEGCSGELRTDWSVPVIDPADASSLEAALTIKKEVAETRITLIHLGPASGEWLIRRGLALGCDEGLRIFDEGLDSLHAPAKALIFARVARILGFDLILTGARSQDTGSGQVGVLLASELGVPYAGPVVACETDGGRLTLMRQLEGGYRERIESPLPMVAAMGALPESVRYAPLPDLSDAVEQEIECLDLPRIGLTDRVVRDSALAMGPLRPPVSKLRFAEAPDSSLPAFLRIRKLVEGTVAAREGKVVTGTEEEVADALFETLKKEGWLDHLGRSRTEE